MASHSFILLCLCAASQVTTLQSHRIQGITQGTIQQAASDILGGAGALQAASDLVGGQGNPRDLFKSVVYDIQDAMLHQVGACHELDAWCNFLERMQKSPEKIMLIALRMYTIYSSITAAWPTPDWATEISVTIKLSAWGVFDEMCDPAYKALPDYSNAQAEWNKTWDKFGTDAPAARTSFEAGNTTAWLPVFRDVSLGLTNTLNAGSPNNKDIWTVVHTSIDGTISSWINYEQGKVALAIGEVWKALYALAEPVFGLDPTTDVGKALAQADIIMTIATTELQNFETKKALAVGSGGFEMCFPRRYTRTSKPVSQCYWGFTYDQTSGHCIASADHGADCEAACSGLLSKACPNFCPASKRYCCKQGLAGSPFACTEARYVELSFAEGTAKDYYQCVSPALSVATASLQELQGGGLLEKESADSALLERARSVATVQARTSLDRSASGKGSSGQSGPTNGNAKAVCDRNSIYTEIIPNLPGQCYEKCPAGYIPEVEGEGDKAVEQVTCLQTCAATDDGRSVAGTFGITFAGGETPTSVAVCSSSKAEITAANDAALSVVTEGMTQLIGTVDTLTKNSELTTAELKKFGEDMAKMIVHFAKPSCGLAVGEVAPTPAPTQ